MEIKNIREVLEQLAQFLQDNLKDGIINKGIFKTGTLADSVQVKYNDDEKEPNFSLTMENYGFYQDSGVNGRIGKFSPNPESLFSPGQFKKDVIGGPLPFPVRKSIAQKGFRPRPFIVPAVNRSVENYSDKLLEAGAEDINEEIIELFKLNGAKV
jgi:hypothetical protein